MGCQGDLTGAKLVRTVVWIVARVRRTSSGRGILGGRGMAAGIDLDGAVAHRLRTSF
jgi:hypothetical protein